MEKIANIKQYITDAKKARKNIRTEQQLRTQNDEHGEHKIHERAIKFTKGNFNRSIHNVKEKFNGNVTDINNQ